MPFMKHVFDKHGNGLANPAQESAVQCKHLGVEGSTHAGCGGAVEEVAVIEEGARKRGNGRVHTVLKPQQRCSRTAALQPLKQAL